MRPESASGRGSVSTTHAAIRLAKRLEPYEPLWLEEPVAPGNIDEMARVAHATSIPVATGERLMTRYEFLPLLQKSGRLPIQEGIETFSEFHREILKDPIVWQDGYIIPPTAPGLGYELDEERIAPHLVAQA